MEETVHEFNRDANATRDKYGKLITDKKKKVSDSHERYTSLSFILVFLNKLQQEGENLVQATRKEVEVKVVSRTSMNILIVLLFLASGCDHSKRRSLHENSANTSTRCRKADSTF